MFKLQFQEQEKEIHACIRFIKSYRLPDRFGTGNQLHPALIVPTRQQHPYILFIAGVVTFGTGLTLFKKQRFLFCPLCWLAYIYKASS